jgi:large subunit ribosomal protein L6e
MPAAPVQTKTVQVGGPKNGGTRVVPLVKPPKYYPAEDVKPVKKVPKVHKPAKIRASITPGTVLVLLAGRFRGKRVVFLKQLESGLLLVSGPFKINGVPLRRVNQAYVLATSTKVDVSGVKVPANVNDAFFKKQEAKKEKKPTEEGMFEKKAEKNELSSERVKAQKEVDAALLTAVKKVPQLKAYLNSSFSLKKGQFPHLLKF